MATVRQLLLHKQVDLLTITPDATVYRALELMAEHNIGALPVVEGGKLLGIVSERDYARNVILKGKASRDTRVREIMVSSPITVEPSTAIEQCMALMTDKRIRHLPVLEDGKLINVISIGDVVKHIISQQASMIDQLQSYITGQPSGAS